MRDEASKRGGKEEGCEKERGNVAGRKEGRKEVEEEKMIGSESRTCNEKGLMNGGRDKIKKRRKKQGREKKGKVGKRRREEKRDRTRSKRERERERERELCRIQAYQNHVCANLFHFLDTSIRTTGCWTAS